MGGGRVIIAVACGAALLVGAARPVFAGPPAVTGVVPARCGETLLCALRTEGVPSAEAVRTMEGGLPSSVELHLRLLDHRARSLVQRSYSLRLAFDLWDEIFRVEGPLAEKSFDTLGAMEAYLAVLDSLPVAPWGILEQGEAYRIEVEMVHHAVAPAQVGRIGEWIAGDRSGVTGDPAGREVSFGLGSLIRFFYQEGRDEGGEKARFLSDPFKPGELNHETN